MMKLGVLACALAVASAQCPPLVPTPVPDNAAELDVTNFRALAAMGDSISTGFGITNSIAQIREEVFSIGGKSDAVTMATFMRQQNPQLIGLSIGRDAGFNAAVSGAVVNNMPSQANTLVTRFRNSNELNFDNDWKLVTIWIGGNNICAACGGADQHTARNYGEKLDEALGILHENVPRVVVNLVTQFNFSSLYDATNNVPSCFVNRLACSCVMSSGAAVREEMNVLAQAYNTEMRIIADKYNNSPRRDFGVILQTMAIDSVIPDRSVLSTFDCFHPNRRAHQVIGLAGYGQLFKTPAERSRAIDFENPQLECGTDANKRVYMG